MKQSTKSSGGIGVPLLSEKQDRSFQLMRQGMNNVHACQTIGISRKTGTRWRLGRTERKHGMFQTYAPVGSAAIAPISPRFLAEDERVRIADPSSAGLDRSSDRCRSGSCTVDGEPRVDPEHRVGQSGVSTSSRAPLGCCPSSATQAEQARH